MKRVLLVDDNPDARRVLRLVLESQGLECVEVLNGADALAWLAEKTSDLIVTDNQMPVLSGLEFVKQLATQAETKFPPVILLSGRLSPADKVAAREAGVYAILDKPCNFSEFVSVVNLALDVSPV